MRDRRNTNPPVLAMDSHEKGAAASSSSSPALPAPVTGRSKARAGGPRVGVWKAVAVTCGLVVLWYWVCGGGRSTGPARRRLLGGHAESETEWVAAHDVPAEPAALGLAAAAAAAAAGSAARWTISIPHNWTFPLPGRYYRDMCSRGHALRTSIAAVDRGRGRTRAWRPTGDVSRDPTFLDVAEAERAGALPESTGVPSDVCPRSMTFVLEPDGASFGQTLLWLWLSYGLAQEEGRSFFVDDSTWAWGTYASYFTPPPAPDCSPPPAHHIVPCPPSARHLVVSSATTAWTFGAPFRPEFQDLHPRGRAARRRIFQLIRTGYRSLFHLREPDASYADARIAHFQHEASASHGLLIGMHVRRGDRHPYEYQYRGDYLPLHRYTDAAHALLRRVRGGGGGGEPARSPLAVASDDPHILHDPDLRPAAAPLAVHAAQARIQLATKAALDHTAPVRPLRHPGSPYVKHVDENAGWDGGFYPALFWSLGRAPADPRATPPDRALRLRTLVGRAYLLDLAVLAAGDGVVCAVSSATCRALAVMMGWEKVVGGCWVNVDDRRGWEWDSGSR